MIGERRDVAERIADRAEPYERARPALSAEDTVLDVMDFLVGFSSSHMRL